MAKKPGQGEGSEFPVDDQEHAVDPAPPAPAGDGGGKRMPEFSTERMFVASRQAEIPEKIGDFKIRRKIAEGGMGIVFEAMQEKPRRKVALKIIKPGVVSPRELRRFTFESQVLGRLRHHGIAQVYQAGVHEEGGQGIPYFVMEYVPHPRTILEFAAKKHMDQEARIRIFRKVLDAVHHGHQKGIIHRDLKPGNILVDPTGQPKVIDFGVARATDSDQVATTLQTDIGGIIGTLQYMSPEQFDAEPDDIDIRSDVYALGVVLYELLCEAMPYDLTTASIAEAARTVKEDLPSKPSRVNRNVRGDLETIILKALEKDRDRRYQSALELEQDLTRFLHHEPIEARRPSSTYHVRMFAKRHTGAFIGMVGIFVLLVGSTLVISILLGRALDAEEKAQNAAQEAKLNITRQMDAAEALSEQRDAAKATETAALKAKEDQAALFDFMTTRLLATMDAREARLGGNEFIADRPYKEVLDQAAADIEKHFQGKPLLEAQIRIEFAKAYASIGSDESKDQYQRAYYLVKDREGFSNDKLLSLRSEIAWLNENKEELEEIQAEQAVQFGESSEDALATSSMIAKIEGQQFPKAAAFRMAPIVDKAEQLGMDKAVAFRIDLCNMLLDQEKYDEAIDCLKIAVERAREEGKEYELLLALNQLAVALSRRGRDMDTSLALDTMSEVVEINSNRLPRAHPYMLENLNSLAAFQRTLGDTEAARKTIADMRSRLRDAGQLASDRAYYLLDSEAKTYFEEGNFEAAATVFEDLLKLQEKLGRPAKGEQYTKARTSYAVCLSRLGGRLEDARLELEDNISQFTEEEQSKLDYVVEARARYANVLNSLERYEEAEALMLFLLEDQERNGRNFESAKTRHELAYTYQRLDQYEKSIAQSNIAVEHGGAFLGNFLRMRARTRVLDGQDAPAVADYEAAIDVFVQNEDDMNADGMRVELADLHEANGRPGMATAVRAEIEE